MAREQALDQRYKGKTGTIIIEFYKTEQFERKFMPNRVHTKQYEQHFIEDVNKKSSFADSIRIKEGKTFTVQAKGGGGGSNNRSQKRFEAPFNGGQNNSNQFRKRDQKFDDKRGGHHH